MAHERIYLSVPHMGPEELTFVQEAFASNWLSSVGPNLDAFEQEMAAYLGGTRHALAVTSGTAALHLILRAIGVGAGDRVAVSTLTFAGSVFPITYLGAQPVFIDSERISGNIDASLVEEYLRAAAVSGTLPKALVAVHLYGQHCDIDRIAAACTAFGVVLVEDAAESLGARYRGRPTGTTASYALLSFNGNKIITTTGGGMILCDDPAQVARMKKWANQSREPAIEYVHAELGYNYRMSNVLAGIGRGQLRVLDDRVASRRAVFDRYVASLGDAPGVTFQPEAGWGTHTRWLSVCYLDAAAGARTTPAALVTSLAAENIEARPVWRPMHTQPLYAGAECVGGAVAEDLYRTGICLPSSSSLLTAQQDRVIERCRSLLVG
ncbi:MAG: DegT/DnrJ/EryC1/StrS family aminotransferase [Gemmatimonadaceae bacterium]|nr:DegT/DnrJ/EryC1/StrS family aminotransferase [Gemmatimonadaceae bacterium]